MATCAILSSDYYINIVDILYGDFIALQDSNKI
jgi:hypothetical protein